MPSTRLEKLKRQRAAESRHGHAPDRQNEDPQEQRAFVRTPQRRDLVEQRQLRIGIARHIQHGKIIVHKAVHQAGKCHGDEDELAGNRRTRHGHPGRLGLPGADQAEKCLRETQHEGKDEGEYSEFCGHGFP